MILKITYAKKRCGLHIVPSCLPGNNANLSAAILSPKSALTGFYSYRIFGLLISFWSRRPTVSQNPCRFGTLWGFLSICRSSIAPGKRRWWKAAHTAGNPVPETPYLFTLGLCPRDKTGAIQRPSCGAVGQQSFSLSRSGETPLSIRF